MNEIQANNFITKIERQGQNEQRLVVRILHAVEDDKIKTAKILQAVEIYIDELKRPINYRKEQRSNNNAARPAASPNPARKLKQTLNNPGQAFDRYLTKQKNTVVKKAKVWARDHIARPVVAVALRIVGMEMKK